MKKIKDTFTLEKLENTDEYMKELQDTLDKLSVLIHDAGKYICNDEAESEYPIWEYVIHSNHLSIPYIIAELITEGYCNTGLEDDKEAMKDILEIIHKYD